MGEASPVEEELSGRETALYKFLLPAILLGVFLLAFVQVSFVTGFKGDGGPSLRSGLVVLAMAGLAWWMFAIHFFPLKRVWLTPTGLRVSNGWASIEIPLESIESISQATRVNIRPVAIELDMATRWGSRLVFVPRDPAPPWALETDEDPVVRRLRERVAAARSRFKPPASTRGLGKRSPMADEELDGPL